MEETLERRTNGENCEQNVSVFYWTTKPSNDFLKENNFCTSLIVVGGHLKSLKGIESFSCLEELWLVHAKLGQQDIDPIRKCTGLNRLYLYDNELTAVPDLGGLDKLTHLWLSNNQITSLQNIDKLRSLKELYISNNNITEINFDQNKTIPLVILNMSGNPISNIKEIQKLSFLRKLHTLMIADPLCRPSSVTLLENFHSYVIYNLISLRNLDMIQITDSERKQIKKFYRDKRQYYRVIICNRLAKLFSEEKVLLDSINDGLEVIWSALHSHGPTENKTTEKKSSNLQFWEAEADRWKERRAFFLGYYKTLREFIIYKTELELELVGNLTFEELLLEDNIVQERFNEKINTFICFHLKTKVIGVTLKHVWRIKGTFQTTVQQSEFRDSMDSVHILYPVQDLSISPLQLVEQLLLGNRLEGQLKVTNCLVNADQLVSNISSLHHQLLLRSQQLLSSRMLVLCAVISNNQMTKNDDFVRQCPYCKISEVDKSIVVPLFLVHFQYEFQDYFKPLKLSPPKPTRSSQSSSTQLFRQHATVQNITKLVLSNASIKQLDVPVMAHVTSLDLSYNQIEELCSVSFAFPKLTSLNLAFNKIKVLDNIQTLENLTHLDVKWNFIYNFLNTVKMLKNKQHLKLLDLDWNPFQDVVSNEHQYLFMTKYLKTVQTYNHQSVLQCQNIGEFTLSGQDQLPMIPCGLIPQEPIALSWHPGLGSLGKGNHMCLSGDNVVGVILRDIKLTQFNSIVSLENLKWLNLSCNLISDPLVLKCLQKLKEVNLSYNVIETFSCSSETFKYLSSLNLSCNFITSLSSFSSKVFPHLRLLELSSNRIQSLEGISKIKSLVELYLAHNRLKDNHVIAHCKVWQDLRVIDLSYNPLEHYSHVRQACIYYLHSIKFINGVKVQDHEVKSAIVLHGGLLNYDFLIRMYKKTALVKLSHLSLSNCYITQVLIPTGALINMTSVTLEHNNITSLSWVAALPKLTRLNLSHNRVCCYSDYQPATAAAQPSVSVHTLILDHNCIRSMVSLHLDLFPNLKLLVLSDNMISVLSGLKNNLHLEQLVLDRNRLNSISKEETEKLENLIELYLEQNSLTQLDFLCPLKKLQNLFLAHNKLMARTSLSPLAQLLDLRELTVHGNPLFRGSKSYHDYLPDLPSLQMLDGHRLTDYTTSS